MAAPRGNTFWKIRAKHGRDALFTSPALLKEEAFNYFEWCDKHPLEQNDFVGKDAIEVIIKKKRVYTLQGLTRYLGAHTDYWREFRHSIIGRSKEFSPIIREIEETIYDQKFTGAASGFFNSSIIARDLGLADKQETKLEVTPAQGQIDYSKLSQSALDEIANATTVDALDAPADGFSRPIPIDKHTTVMQPVPLPDQDGSDLI